MSAVVNGPNGGTGDPTDPPEFELDFLVDDAVNPTELTVFSPTDDEITTHWISVDVDSAVPIQAVR